MIATLKRIILAAVTPSFEPREAVDGQAAWEAFQDDYRLKEETEKARHGRVNDVRAEKTRLVHAALERVVPTEGREGPVVA